MNFFTSTSTSFQALSTSPWSGAPLAESSQALARLAPESGETGGFLQGLFDQVQAFQMELLTALMSLMVGLPGTTAGADPQPVPPPTDHQTSAAHGKHIPGGRSNYKNGMFHKGDKGAPNSYAFENSPAGIKFAAQHHFSSIDLDMQITKDGVPVNTHWDRPMAKDGFYDPLHKLGRNTKVKDMTLAEISRLRNKDGQSMIRPVADQLAELKKYGIAGDFEAKMDPRFATAEVMGPLADAIRKAGIHANLKAIDHGPLTFKILKEAQAQGFYVRTAHGAGKAGRNIGYGN